MKSVGIAAAASLALCAQAMAEPVSYAVNGVTLGTQVDRSNASYREYACSPSEQFGALTWCQKARPEKDHGKAYSAAYSLLHSGDGHIVYVNRWQEPSYLNATSAQQEIERYSRKFGGKPKLINVPAHGTLPQGMIATWGEVTLEPLDAASVKLLAAGKSPKKGLLIDHLGNFERSAKGGLPVYRIAGGPGFVWSASFDQKGHGALRMVAVDASALVVSTPPQSPSQPEAGAEPQAIEQPAGAAQPQMVADAAADTQAPAATQAAGETSAEAQADAPAQPAADTTPSTASDDAAEANADPSALMQRIGKLQQQLASANAIIGELEKGKAAAAAAQSAAAKAKRSVEARVAQLEAGGAAGAANNTRWENALYGAAGGLAMVLLASVSGFFWKSYKARSSMAQASGSAQSASAADGGTFVASPALALAEDAFGRELEQQVAALNATEPETQPEAQPQAKAGSEAATAVTETPVTEEVQPKAVEAAPPKA